MIMQSKKGHLHFNFGIPKLVDYFIHQFLATANTHAIKGQQPNHIEVQVRKWNTGSKIHFRGPDLRPLIQLLQNPFTSRSPLRIQI